MSAVANPKGGEAVTVGERLTMRAWTAKPVAEWACLASGMCTFQMPFALEALRVAPQRIPKDPLMK